MEAWAEDPANANRNFTSLSEKDREDVWMAEWDRDPRAVAEAMWNPSPMSSTGPQSLNNSQGSTKEDRAKTKAVEDMLIVKFLFACDEVCQYAVVGTGIVLPGFPAYLVSGAGVSKVRMLPSCRGMSSCKSGSAPQELAWLCATRTAQNNAFDS